MVGGRLHGLDLFSGIAGNTIALSEWVKTLAYCEADKHAQSVLLSRMGDGSIESAPIWDDVSTLKGDQFDIPIDIILGGFPCQDISVAGKGVGLAGERSGLVYEVFRLIREIKPTFVFLENVPAIRTRGLGTVVKELASLGYDCRWDMLSAAEMGAPHKRERWFLLAHAGGKGLEGDGTRAGGAGPEVASTAGCCGAGSEQEVADSECPGRERASGERLPRPRRPPNESAGGCGSPLRWEVEPNVGRVANGVPFRVERLKRLGNAVVPVQAQEAFCWLMGINHGL